MKIAVSGKGGVGKTLIAGGLAMGFVDRGLNTIAIDADPSPNLALTLGLSSSEARKIVPVSKNEELVKSKTNTGYSGVYRLSFTVDDVVKDYSVDTPLGVNLLVMGSVQSMGSGCMCAANHVVRALLRHLVVERNEAVILDMEAGIEHIGRGTAKHVDVMLLVVDSNLKSLEIARNIYTLAKKAGMQKIFLIGNRIMNKTQKRAIAAFAEINDLPVIGSIPFDQSVIEADMKGETPLKNKESKAVKAINDICTALIEKNI